MQISTQLLWAVISMSVQFSKPLQCCFGSVQFEACADQGMSQGMGQFMQRIRDLFIFLLSEIPLTHFGSYGLKDRFLLKFLPLYCHAVLHDWGHPWGHTVRKREKKMTGSPADFR